LYRDRQNVTLSKIGATATYLYNRIRYHDSPIIDGLEHLQSAEPAVIAPTHQSKLDIPLMGYLAWRAKLRPPTYIARVSLVDDDPKIGRVLPYLGAFYINQSKQDSQPMERHIRNSLESTRSVILFPEGTRRAPGEPIKLERGLGIIAVNLGLIIVPVGIYGTERAVKGQHTPVGIAIGESLSPGNNPMVFRKKLTQTLTGLRDQARQLVS